MQCMLKEQRLRWSGCAHYVEISIIPRQAIYWTPENRRRRVVHHREAVLPNVLLHVNGLRSVIKIVNFIW